MTAAEIERFIDETFPKARSLGWVIDAVAHRRATVRLPVADHHLRPGGTVSGPTLMALTDTAMYFALLASIGPVALAVTTNLNINFLRRPSPDHDVVAEAEILKLGARLAVGQVTIASEGEDEPVAHATVTYSIPPAA